MSSTRCVILIDEQTFVNNCKHVDNERTTRQVRQSVLQLLLFFGQNEVKDSEKFQWGHTIFNSQGPELQVLDKQLFTKFNLRSFELFEEQLITKSNLLNTNIRQNDENAEPETNPDPKHVKNVLKQALGQVCTDYNWDKPDFSSPIMTMRTRRRVVESKKSFKNQAMCMEKSQNYIFVISPLEKYSLKNIKNTRKNIFELLIPNSLYTMLTKDSKIELFWLDKNVHEYCHKYKLCENYEIQQASKFGLIPLNIIAKENAKIGNKTITIQRDAAVLLSTVLNRCFQKRKNTEKHEIIQLPVKMTDDSSYCSVIISAIWKNEHFQAMTLFDKMKEWKSLKIQCTIKHSPLLFNYQTGYTFSATPAKPEDNSPFSALMLESMAQNMIIVLECQSENGSKLGVLRPLTLSAASFIIPYEQNLPPVVEDTQNLQIDSGHTKERTSGSFNTSCLERWAINEGETAKIEETTRIDQDLLNKIKNFILTGKKNEAGASSSASSKKKIPKEDVLPQMDPLTSDKHTLKRRSTSSNLNVSSRSCLLLERSLSMKSLPAKESQKKPSEISRKRDSFKNNANFTPTLNITEDSKEENVIAYLKDLYTKATNENGTWSLLQCAQTIVSSLSLLSTTSNDANIKDLVEKNFFVDSKILFQRCHTPSKRVIKSREILLQTLLRLELQLLPQKENTVQSCIDTVVSLLRFFCFVEGPLELNKFLHEVVKENFGETLRDLVEEIGEELSIPLFDDTTHSESEDKQPLSQLSRSSIGSASPTSVASQKNDNRRRKSVVRHPSFAQTRSQVQIQIQVAKKIISKKKGTPKYKHRGVKSRLRSSSLKKNERKKESQSEVKKVCRNLFQKSPRSKKSLTPKRKSSPLTQSSCEKKKTPTKSGKACRSKLGTPKTKGRTPTRKSLLDSFLPLTVKAPESNKTVNKSLEPFLFQDLMTSPVHGKTPENNTPSNTPVPKRISSIMNNSVDTENVPKARESNSQMLYGLESPLISIYMKKPSPVPNNCVRNLSFCQSPVKVTDTSTLPMKSVSNDKDDLSSPKRKTPVKSKTLDETPAKNTRSRSNLSGTPSATKENHVCNSDESTELHDNKVTQKPQSITRTPNKGVDTQVSKTPLKTPPKSLAFSDTVYNSVLTPQKLHCPTTPNRSQKRKLSRTPSKSPRVHKKDSGYSTPLVLYSQLHISPEEIQSRRELRSHFHQSPMKTLTPKVVEEYKSYETTPISSPGIIKCPNANGVISPKDLTLKRELKKRRLSYSCKIDNDKETETEWTVVPSPKANKSLTMSFKKVPSINELNSNQQTRNTDTINELPNQQTLCREQKNNLVVSPPLKRIHAPSFKSPSALSLLHLTVSPILDLPLNSKKKIGMNFE